MSNNLNEAFARYINNKAQLREAVDIKKESIPENYRKGFLTNFSESLDVDYRINITDKNMEIDFPYFKLILSTELIGDVKCPLSSGAISKLSNEDDFYKLNSIMNGIHDQMVIVDQIIDDYMDFCQDFLWGLEERDGEI